jgi:hypothetical protein
VRVTPCFGILLSAIVSRVGHAQSIILSAQLDDSVYFEGQPVYFVVRLENSGLDTAWTSKPSFARGTLHGSLRVDGRDVPEFGLSVSYIVAPGTRGTALAPRESTYEALVLNTRWGYPGPLSETLYLKTLPPGAYVLAVTFDAEPWVASGPLRLRTETRFRVRERTASEEALLGETEQFATTAFDRAQWDPSLRACLVE